MATKRSDRKVMLSVRVPEWLRQELREIAVQEDRRLSEQVTRALREFCQAYNDKRKRRSAG
jgi:metal-responsive CopG/Arc/MetJ family transcriptional regulator